MAAATFFVMKGVAAACFSYQLGALLNFLSIKFGAYSYFYYLCAVGYY